MGWKIGAKSEAYGWKVEFTGSKISFINGEQIVCRLIIKQKQWFCPLQNKSSFN
jgi:hypothetical protein